MAATKAQAAAREQALAVSRDYSSSPRLSKWGGGFGGAPRGGSGQAGMQGPVAHHPSVPPLPSLRAEGSAFAAETLGGGAGGGGSRGGPWSMGGGGWGSVTPPFWGAAGAGEGVRVLPPHPKDCGVGAGLRPVLQQCSWSPS